MSRRPGPRLAVAAAVSVAAFGLAVTTGRAQTGSQVPAFDASAAADGARFRLEIPGAPISSRLLDVGAPTAQATANSLGSSRGFAALPDPGELIQSAPGLAVGLLAQGAGGLSPIELPQLPPYPLRVVSDVNGTPHAELGEGIYQLEANSTATHSDAKAAGGVRTGVAGNIALLTSSASTGVQDDGEVLATATSDAQGITIGPLFLGRVTSTATVILGPNGAVTPTSDIRISALRVGGVDVAIDEHGLVLGTVPVPVPIADTLETLLGAAGIDVTFTAAQQFDNAVIAPTLTISMPVENDLGSGTGTFSIVLGGATASLTGPTARPARTPTTDLPTDAVPPPSSATSGGAPLAARPSAAAPASPATTAGAAPPAASQPIAADAGPLTGLFDITSTYLTIAGCAAAMYALAQLLRLLGVRPRWT